jgi:CxxC-x17-CxxC domain-containing protein
MEIPEIPLNKDITYLGLSTFRDKNVLFGIKRRDRRQHVYILGKSGTGKSALMFNMIIQNIQNGEGVCMVDPHGENVEGVLSAIPPHRMKDVVYFNPADTDYHIGFNVLELEDPKYKHLVASGLMGIFTKIWANAWSARMEYILNNCILALLDTPGTTLLGIPRILVDKEYRKKIIANLKDPVIKAFWIHEYEAWNEKFRNEAIAPIQNKVGQFLSTSIIRNVVGQSKSTVNVFDMMNEGKIFLVNVSKGRIGEDNAALLGGMIITKIQLAAMERVRIPEDERKDFYLYVDEFQNFVTDAFASILSEARKYRLNLTIAHQYTAQLATKESTAMRDAVFGNVGTMIIFRVGSDDAEFLEKEFEPEFTREDIVNLPNFKIYLKLMIDGITSRPFSARTLPQMVKSGNKKVEEEVINTSRKLYCRPREDIEREINEWSGIVLGSEEEESAVEKFPAICSNCKKETTVPFKPEPGRAVYCKDCIAKIKSGEIKPVRDTLNQIKSYEAKVQPRVVKPLTYTTVEFKAKPIKPKVTEDKNKNLDTEKETSNKVESKIKNESKLEQSKFALKEILNKIIDDSVISDSKVKNDIPKVEESVAPHLPHISLDALKNKSQDETTIKQPNKDEMDKLKNFISKKTIDKTEEDVAKNNKIDNKNIKEVPEDVLRKILE